MAGKKDGADKSEDGMGGDGDSLDFQPPNYSTAPFGLDHFLGLSPSQVHRTRRSTGESNGNEEKEKEKEERVLVSMSLSTRTSSTTSEAGADRTKNVPTNGENEAIALGGRGVVKVSPRDYLEWSLARPPDLLFALADEPNELLLGEVSKKRLEKSVRRSFNWLKEIVETEGVGDRTNLFATLIGNDDFSRRTEFSLALLGTSSSRATSSASPDHSLDPHLAGYVLDSSFSSPLLNASLSPLPRDKLRIATLPRGPHEILRLVQEVGIDLFVEEWSQDCSSFGIALDFDFPVPASSSSSSSNKLSVGVNLYDSSHALSFTPLSNSSLAPPPPEENHPFGPQPPTRSYIHHLLLAHELTSHVTLALHNQSFIQNFFRAIRETLKNGTFEIEKRRFEEMYSGDLGVVEEGRRAWREVERTRGKGSLKEKALLEEMARKEEEGEKVLVGKVVQEGIRRKENEWMSGHAREVAGTIRFTLVKQGEQPREVTVEEAILDFGDDVLSSLEKWPVTSEEASTSQKNKASRKRRDLLRACVTSWSHLVTKHPAVRHAVEVNLDARTKAHGSFATCLTRDLGKAGRMDSKYFLNEKAGYNFPDADYEEISHEDLFKCYEHYYTTQPPSDPLPNIDLRTQLVSLYLINTLLPTWFQLAKFAGALLRKLHRQKHSSIDAAEIPPLGDSERMKLCYEIEGDHFADVRHIATKYGRIFGFHNDVNEPPPLHSLSHSSGRRHDRFFPESRRLAQ
ncbi:uncharacterized protein JCM6883_003647 [Sporobolomyces salmoneus]|uniref:uncharacterized protein n=1 Tax=Sporobolomyces salmoneus TaxID=183962 RepID=UPI00317361CC